MIHPMRPGRHAQSRARHPCNVGSGERWLSLIAGVLAVAGGARRGGTGGAALAVAGGMLLLRGASGRCIVYSRLGLSTARDGNEGLLGRGRSRLRARVVVNRPRTMVYRYWRNLENLPRFMGHLESVRAHGNLSHWVARIPPGLTLRWDAQVVHDTPNERLAWQSVAGSAMETRGEVRFRDMGEGTEIEVDMSYRLPAGQLARWLGGIPEHALKRDLQQFKHMIEQQATPHPRHLNQLDQGLGPATITPAHG